MASHSSSLEDMLVCSQGTPDAQRKLKPPAEQSLKCPRCESTNTKFCYYNNYSLSQPRYFCKSCRRYWTKGGTLRNVPVGGGCRKNKKPSSSKRTSHLDAQFSAVPASPNPGLASSLVYDPIDLGLQFGGPQKHLDREFPVLANLGHHNPGGSSVPGFLDTLRNGIFLETQNNSGTGFGQSLYHGLGHGGGGGGIMFSSYEESAATKGEPFSGNLEGDGRVLWGFPWQVNSDHELDSNSGRAGWTGLNPSTWQGLLNSPLIN